MSQNGIVDGSDAEIRFGLLDLKRQLSACIESGRVDKSVLDLLVTSGGCAPIESELLDYKRDAPTEAVGLAKLAVHVVSFHNTFGGYLIFGVEEEQRDQRFSPRGIARGAINIQQLKTTIRNYTGKSVDITYQDVTISVGERELVLGLLFIPKRLVATAPIKFGKQSPKRDEKYIFQAGDVFYRVQDSNVRAESSEQWWFLASERLNPHAAAENPPVTLIGSRRKIVDENLPDRNVICPGFIGRSETILELWQWLSDDFQFAKVLAGDGGKGKTSIAYQFAEDICRSSPFDFEKVIWLTAKTKQFRGLNDDYDPVHAHFNTYTELLQALCEAMPILPAEIEGATPHLLKQILREAFATTHTFVVIDDVDSLPIEQQRLTFEAASDIGNNQSRFLLTTRRNLTYSSDKWIEVQGFNEQDYSEYVHVFLMRLKSPHLSDSDIEKLRDATDGSPLYTESLLRLVRNGMRLSDAIHTWKGVLGTKVRRAALEREVNQLSSESRRVLLAAVYLFECSYTELRQVTGYDDEQLNQYVDELRGLFLLGAPRITSNEARFAVQSNTRVLISNLAVAKKLAIDPDNIRQLCEKIRTGAPALKKRENKRAIAAAVTQANAFLREREWTSAQETLLVALKKIQGMQIFALRWANTGWRASPPIFLMPKNASKKPTTSDCADTTFFRLGMTVNGLQATLLAL